MLIGNAETLLCLRFSHRSCPFDILASVRWILATRPIIASRKRIKCPRITSNSGTQFGREEIEFVMQLS